MLTTLKNIERKQPWTISPLLLLASIGLLVGTLYYREQPLAESNIGIKIEDFQQGMLQCQNRYEEIRNPQPEKRSKNPRYSVGGDERARSVLIRNATLWNGDGEISYQVDIQLKDGLIVNVGKNLDKNGYDDVVDVFGHVVTPGLVDMHSHAGLDSWPGLGKGDTNEMSGSPVRPELRSLDGIDPNDIALGIVNSGGVTTSLILPGSGNMMGGEAYPIKMRVPKSLRVEHMLLNAGMDYDDGHQWRYMKMACGENPINSYGRQGVLPETRLGEAYLFRKRISTARDQLVKQDAWCYEADNISKSYADDAHKHIKTTFPLSLDEESLIAVLRGKILLNTYDIEMMVRLSKEFGFKIRAFHHALEAWQVAKLLAEEDISVAIFADHWGYKKEAYGTSVKAAQVLNKAGVKVAFKSDHAVLNSQNLIYEAAKAHSYGFDAKLAIQSVTSVPAERIGQDWRIGYVRPGYDADIVVWDKNPLEIGAHPLKVFTDGYDTFTHVDYLESIKKSYNLKQMVSAAAKPLLPLSELSPSKTTTYVNIGGLVHSETATWEPESKIVVNEKDIVTCIGAKCPVVGQVIDLKSGWVIPGIIAAGVHLGIEEISSEGSTSSGTNNEAKLRTSWEGLYVGKRSKELAAAFKAGVTTAISVVKGSGAVIGKSTTFRIGSTKISDETYISYETANHYKVGTSARTSRDPASSSVAGQLRMIKETWDDTADSVNVIGVKY
ncbi:hypothetical protein HDV02_003498 [Globomyces sp. JEL0801]|nr:hypothetical protein HDV02_003498 [Globomyces sp. JEL0801]